MYSMLQPCFKVCKSHFTVQVNLFLMKEGNEEADWRKYLS